MKRLRRKKTYLYCGTLKFQLNKLVTDHHVDGWDDCRLPTLAGLRRRGFTPDAINAFCRGIGITRRYLLLYHVCMNTGFLILDSACSNLCQ